MPIFGTDCSDFDWGRGPMDVASMVADGIAFFTHKATEGTRTQHVHYGEALNRARAAGMPCMGAYMIPRTPGNNGHGSIAQQVAYFLAYLDQQTPWWKTTPEFFIQVDTEHWGYDDVAPQYGAQAAALLREQTGKFVIHYAPRWAYGDTIPGDDPLWASAYGSNPTVPYRQAYPGDNSSGWAAYSGRTPLILQYGSRLTIGSQPGCDGNAFRGTLDQFRALIIGGTAMAALDPDEKALLARAERVLTGDATALARHLGGGYEPYVGAAADDGHTIELDPTWPNGPKRLLSPSVALYDRIVQAEASIAKAIAAIGRPDDAQIQAQADRVAAALIASNANGLTPADHAGVVADVKQALATAAKAEADALAQG